MKLVASRGADPPTRAEAAGLRLRRRGRGALVALMVAYRRQRVAEATTALETERWQATSEHERSRVFNERFTAIAAQLGHDQPAVRLAGVHAMAGLADDWEANRQTCVDVLCAYLRMPYKADPGEAADMEEQLAYRAMREVRHTVITVITAKMGPPVLVHAHPGFKSPSLRSWPGASRVRDGREVPGFVWRRLRHAQEHAPPCSLASERCFFSGQSSDPVTSSAGRSSACVTSVPESS